MDTLPCKELPSHVLITNYRQNYTPPKTKEPPEEGGSRFIEKYFIT